MITMLALAAMLAPQDLAACKVGLRVPKAGALNYPGVIIAVDAAKGSYNVKFDSDGRTQWMPATSLRFSCVGAAAAPVGDTFWIGKWEMFIGPAPQYQVINGDRYLVTGTGAVAPPLTVNADGTYVWVIDRTKTITGRWRRMQPAEMKYGFKDKPGILLMKGEGGADWQVTRSGTRMADNRDQLGVERMDLGLSYLATRMK